MISSNGSRRRWSRQVDRSIFPADSISPQSLPLFALISKRGLAGCHMSEIENLAPSHPAWPWLDRMALLSSLLMVTGFPLAVIFC